jgi:integrase
MRGHVRKRGNTWSVVYDEGYDDNGKRRQRWRGGFATKRDAQKALTERLHSLGEGTYVEPSKVTLAAFVTDEWLPAIEDTVRPSTFSQYGSAVRTHIVPRLGSRRLQALTGGHLNAFYAELDKEVGLAPSTRRFVHAVLHRILKDAVRWGKLTLNPAERADPPKPSNPRAHVWTAKELGRFLAAVADDRLFALWRLAATTGMRRGELLGLTWRALDIDGCALTVTQQLLPTGMFGPPKSERSERTIMLDPETVDALKRHREAQLLERSFAGDAYSDQDLVFADELGNPIVPQRLSDRFLTRRKRAGIPVGTLHTLRHTAATLMLIGDPKNKDEEKRVPGMPLHVVAARLGDRPETVLATYAHLLPSSDEQAAAGMATLLANAVLTNA